MTIIGKNQLREKHMASNHLRRIAVSVDEPKRGKFYWLLTESTGDTTVWNELYAAKESVPTYGEALRTGVGILMAMGSDGDGPRLVGEDENLSPVG
ncbi:hypothetical protein J2X19_001789 [Rhodoferax ferrireducens]|uniref:Uncharacterized protein n=2 Tax=Rhodoferax ferrireducens TaxID=192843 RepID=A0ABU2C756_9BURK|nr:hypothetical protein [Rhodoferax ferrireducens]